MIIQAKDTKIEKLGVAKYSAKIFSKIIREQDFILYDPFHKKQKFSSTNTEQPAFLRAGQREKIYFEVCDKVFFNVVLFAKFFFDTNPSQ